jgi:hypothetical protein
LQKTPKFEKSPKTAKICPIWSPWPLEKALNTSKNNNIPFSGHVLSGAKVLTVFSII